MTPSLLFHFLTAKGIAMFSKIIVGIAGLALLGVGGFLYWDHHNCPLRNSCGSRGNCQIAISPCCQQQEISTSTPVEELTIMPREVVDVQE